MVGTGPYKYVEHDPERVWVFERFDDYWGGPPEQGLENGPRTAPKAAYIDRIEYYVITDPATRVSAVLADEVDIAAPISADAAEAVADEPGINIAVATEEGRRAYWKFNTTVPPFDNHALRLAVRTGFDPEAAMAGFGPPEYWKVNCAPRLTELHFAYQDYCTDEYFPRDIEAARQLVEESGYDGTPVVLLASEARPEYPITIPMITYLEEIGINVEPRIVDGATYSEMRRDPASGWNIKIAGGQATTSVMYLNAPGVDRQNRIWPGLDPAFLDLIDQASAAIDLDERRDLIHEAYEILMDAVVDIWVGDELTVALYRDRCTASATTTTSSTGSTPGWTRSSPMTRWWPPSRRPPPRRSTVAPGGGSPSRPGRRPCRPGSDGEVDSDGIDDRPRTPMTSPSNEPDRAPRPFVLEEATIDELHAAIRAGETTCVQVVEHYLRRVRCVQRGRDPAGHRGRGGRRPARGVVRGGQPLEFPTATVAAAELLPDLDRYQGPPLELGRMEPTASDPEVDQQFGMITGIPDGGQLNALGTINLRGERSVVCKGDFDRAPEDGPLPPDAPAVCEVFRRYPDALEQAAALDAAYGTDPDLEAMPLYGVVVSFKDPFDTKDMRSTGGADARYDIDFPARDHLVVERLRRAGAIIFAKAVNTEYNGRPGTVGAPAGGLDGRHLPDAVLPSTLGYQRSTWAGNPVNPYDTTRAASLGSSSGSGVSVSANLCMVSIGEETRASCRGPANHNGVALILPHKAMLGFDGGAIGADPYVDRTGILARTLADCAKVLDALRDPVDDHYYDPRDPYTTVPRSSVLDAYAVHVADEAPAGVLAGTRIGVVRESMLDPGTRAVEPIIDAASREIKEVLGGMLGATLVESTDPLWAPDPDLEQMDPDFRRALARLVPMFMPDLLFRLDPDGRAGVRGVRRGDHADRVRAREDVRLRHARPDRLPGRARGRRGGPATQPRRVDRAAPDARERLPLPHQPVPVPPRRGLAGGRVRRDARRLGCAQRALEVLGRRPACGVPELGGGHRSPQPAGRAPGRRRADHAPRAAAPRRHDGDVREPPRRARPAPHAAAAGRDRRAGRAWRDPATDQRVPVLAERRAHRGAGSRRLRADGLRRDVRAQRGSDPLRRPSRRHADRAARAGAPVLARVPCRAGLRGRAPAGGLQLRGREPPADPATGLRPDPDGGLSPRADGRGVGGWIPGECVLHFIWRGGFANVRPAPPWHSGSAWPSRARVGDAHVRIDADGPALERD
jgi:Asp-tRNA(Asn)/Glu-tRNA(Gln) amidotransferase A subunit family amidase